MKLRNILLITGILLGTYSLYFYATHDGMPLSQAVAIPTITRSYPQLDIPSLLQATNQERVTAGVRVLRLDERLNRSASDKCNDMVVNDYWGHADTKGKHGYDFIRQYMPIFRTASENLADGYNTSQTVTQGWMNSPNHKRAVLDNRYTSVGFGLCKEADKQYVVQHFVQE